MEVSFSNSAYADLKRSMRETELMLKRMDDGQDDTNAYLECICNQNQTIINLLTEINNSLKRKM